MKCRLYKNKHYDDDFEIEFNDAGEIQQFAERLYSMAEYIRMCQESGSDHYELKYVIREGEI